MGVANGGAAFVVDPNELDKEPPTSSTPSPALARPTAWTRSSPRSSPPTKGLTYEDLTVTNRATVDNVKIWDHGPLRST